MQYFTILELQTIEGETKLRQYLTEINVRRDVMQCNLLASASGCFLFSCQALEESQLS